MLRQPAGLFKWDSLLRNKTICQIKNCADSLYLLPCGLILKIIPIFFSMRLTILFCLGLFSHLTYSQSHSHSKIQLRTTTCNLQVDAGEDIVLCNGNPGQLSGSAGGNYTSLEWTPATGLSDPTIFDPIVDVSSQTVYTLTVMGIGDNVIENGDFETGDINPASSSLSYYDPNTFYAGPQGTYTVTSVFQVTGVPNICDPHGGNNMMVVHGGSPNMWCQTVSVEPHTDYKFSGWFMGTDFLGLIQTTDVDVKINGQSIGGTGSNSICTWVQVKATWNSGTATSATICIDGNGDNSSWTAIDDLELVECCVEKDQVTVRVETVEADIPFGGVLTCLNPTLQLDGKRLSKGPIQYYEWDTPDGEIVEGASRPVVTISKKGTYNLTVTGQLGCTAEASILVEGNTEPPPLDVGATPLTCLSDSARIISKSMGDGLVYSWTGPDSFKSSKPIDTVQKAGKYYIRIKDNYFCENEDSVIVVDLRTNKSYDIAIDSLNCERDSATVFILNDSIITEYHWMNDQKTEKDTNRFTVRDTGIIYAAFKDKYGCEWEDTIHIEGDLSLPNLLLAGDSITCTQPEATLTAHSDSVIANYQWQYPDGSTASGASVTTQQPGWHYITITPAHGCPREDSIFVRQIGEIPTLSIQGDTITCSKTSVTLTAQTNQPTATPVWTGPGIVRANGLQATVNQSGTYTLTLTTSEGCSRSMDYTVIADTIPPMARIEGDSIVNCISPSVRLAPTVSPNTPYQWTVPPTIVYDRDTVITDVEGWHYLTATGINGCITKDSIYISVDTTRPGFVLGKEDYTCRTTTAKTWAVPDKAGDYYWKLPGESAYQSGDTLKSVTDSGWVYFKEILKNGCAREDSIFVRVDTLAPSFIAGDDTLECGVEDLTLRLQVVGEYEMVKWTGPNGFSSNALNPVVHQGGDYVATITGKNGCVSLANVHIEQVGEIPDIAITNADTIDCNHPTVTLSPQSTISSLSFDWTFPDGSHSADNAPTVSDSGWYLLTVKTPEGCTNTAKVYVALDQSKPTVDWEVATLTCDSSLEVIHPKGMVAGLSFRWEGPNDFISDQPVPDNVVAPGWYTVHYYGKNGCIQVDSLLVIANRIPPDLQVTDDTLDCVNKTAVLTFNSSKGNLLVQWKDQTGQLLSTDQQLSVRDSGIYTVIVRDPDNQCTNIARITVLPPNEIKAVNIDEMQDCTDPNTLLEISDVQGGTAPYEYAFDNGAFQASNRWNTHAGTWKIQVRDAKGCSYEEVITIDSLIRLAAGIIAEIELLKGAGKKVTVTTNRQPNEILTYTWDPTDGLSCSDCPDPTVAPETNTTYTIIVEDIFGCMDTISLRVLVKTSDKVYVPNTFNPASGGINGRFKVFLPEGTDARLLSMKIFDRWGELVYDVGGIAVSQHHGWDGSHKGDLLNPGVYVYRIQLRLESGKEVTLTGDVTLLR